MFDFLKEWGPAIQAVFILVNAVMLIVLGLLRRVFVSKDDHTALTEAMTIRIADVEGDMHHIKTRVETLPEHKHVAQVREGISNLSGDIRALSKEIEGMKSTMRADFKGVSARINQLDKPLQALLEHHITRERR